MPKENKTSKNDDSEIKSTSASELIKHILLGGDDSTNVYSQGSSEYIPPKKDKKKTRKEREEEKRKAHFSGCLIKQKLQWVKDL